jgi:hypothetical protein
MATKTKSRTKLNIGGPFRHVAGYESFMIDRNFSQNRLSLRPKMLQASNVALHIANGA